MVNDASHELGEDYIRGVLQMFLAEDVAGDWS
jgi:hypothetical protein